MIHAEELHRDAVSSRVNEAAFSLPLSTAIQIALVRLLWSWGITPTAVSSHSSGEVAAAYAAGALTCRAAIGITYIRGSLTLKPETRGVNGGNPKGGMMAIGLSRDQTNAYISKITSGCLTVACVNSPCSVTVSGDIEAIDELEQVLAIEKVFARRLKVTEAFHSEHMRPMAHVFGASLLGLLQSGDGNDSIVFASPKTGGNLHALDILAHPNHWVDSMLQPVEFESAFLGMCFGTSSKCVSLEPQVDIIIEIGPHGALGGPIRHIMTLPQFDGAREIPYLSCLSRGQSAQFTMHQLAIELTKRGHTLDMDAINFPRGRRPEVNALPNLPTYPWNHQNRYWREPRQNRAYNHYQHVPHDLAGSLQPTSTPSAPTWRQIMRVSDIPWMRHHIVESKVVFPAAGFISMALEAVSQLTQSVAGHSASYALQDVEFSQALIIPDDEEGVETLLAIRPCSNKALGMKDWYEFQIYSVSAENAWSSHCTGLVRVSYSPLNSGSIEPGPRTLLAQRPWSDMLAYTREVDPNDLWKALRTVGICHGPTFQNIRHITSRKNESLTSFSVADTMSHMPHKHESHYIIHPTTLDSILQAGYCALPSAGTTLHTALIPRRIKSLRTYRMSAKTGCVFNAHTCLHQSTSQSFDVDIGVSDDSGLVLEMAGLTYQSLGAAAIGEEQAAQIASESSDSCISWQWSPDISLLGSHQLHEMMKTSMDPTEIDLIKDLRRCTLHYIQEIVESLTADDIDGLEAHHIKLYAWMMDQLRLAAEGNLGSGSASWLLEDAADREALRVRVTRGSVNGEMLTRLGPKTIAMMRHEIAPLQLMMEDALLSRYYVDALKWNRSSTHASQLVQHCTHRNPRSKVLEIGGGTGGCTQVVLDRLEKYKLKTGEAPISRYEFTDISSGFFEAARERFESWQDVMTFRKLNIEDNPEDQGFQCGTYDIVIACQVLHATANIERTLRHVRSLLKPGGRLIMVETTHDQLDLFFTFGLLPGWWLSEEKERQSTPSLSTLSWDRALRQSSFHGVDLEVRDCESDEYYMLSTIMATAVDELNKGLMSDECISLVYGSGKVPPGEWVHSLQSSLAESTGCSRFELQPLSEIDASHKYCIFLGEVEQSVLSDPVDDQFRSIVAMATQCKGLLWVTRGAAMDCQNPWGSLHLGVVRTLRNEHGVKQYVSIDLDPSGESPWSTVAVSAIMRVFTASVGCQAGRKSDTEYSERDGIIYIPRAMKDKEMCNSVERCAAQIEKDHNSAILTQQPFRQANGRALRMDIATPGLIDTLFFREETPEDDDSSHKPLHPGWVEIEPRAFGLNFRDVMVAMGQLEANQVMGFECAGIITNLDQTTASESGLQVGDRVCALLRGHWATKTRTPWTSVIRIPDDLGFVEGASVPLVFATAYVALEETARLRKGEKVLIHAGAGGVGQAAMMLAKLVGAEIFVTAGNITKRAFIAEKFDIQPDHIFSSRDASFADAVLAATDGKGVDVVLNSLAGTLLQTSFNCLAEFGRFIDIGKRDFEQNSRLDMLSFTRNVSFSSIDLLLWQRCRGGDIFRTMQAIGQLFNDKAITPVTPITTYPISSVEKAFRLIQSGQHMGKIVVSVDQRENLVPVRLRREEDESPRVALRPDASYVVVGGLGGIGRCVCEWLIAHGARHLVILSRSARAGPYLASLAEPQAAGPGKIHIRPIACDVSDQNQLSRALKGCPDMPPIRGVIQGAMVLKVRDLTETGAWLCFEVLNSSQDSLIDQMTLDEYNAAVLPKARGSWNLHKQLGELDFFVMLSSLIGVMGGAGQANYAAGCAFQDALAAHRRAQGQAAVSVDLGMVKSVGYVAKTETTTTRGKSGAFSVSDRLARLGFRTLHEDQILRILETCIVNGAQHSTLGCPSTIIAGINTGPGSHWTEADWMHENRFAGLQYREKASSLTANRSDLRNRAGSILHQTLSEAESLGTATRAVLDAMTEKLTNMFGLGDGEITASRSLAGLGVDSLVAVELRNWLVAQVAADISIFDLMQNMSLGELSELVVRKSSLVGQDLLAK
jgi:NADPH:quinone reductase-like Zn-dependent oxidoreductase/ubiquinone/menaquinone biosynthesis C-methylase UbiE